MEDKVKILAENTLDSKEMKASYTASMIELAKINEKIVALDADLLSCSGMGAFAKEHPNKLFNCGIQEANMVGVAAGLSAVGKIPYIHTFAPFATRRVYDQVFLSCAYAKSNVKIIGSDPGVTAMYNGGTHMPFEDMGLMRMVPDAVVLEPTDSVMLKDILFQLADFYGVSYTRILRKNPIKIYEDGSKFEIGKSVKLREGNDVTIIAQGALMVPESLKAYEMLKKDGINARVLDMFTLKPIDKAAIISAAEETGAIVTAENHNVINGLASAVSEVIVENKLVPMGKVGVFDKFGQVGSLGYLQEVYGLTAENIYKTVKETLKRK